MVKVTQLEVETSRITQLEVETAKITQLSEAVAAMQEQIADRPQSLPTATMAVKIPTKEIMTELVNSGMQLSEIATQLENLGYTNTIGKPIDRDRTNRLIQADPDLKAAYDTGKPTEL